VQQASRYFGCVYILTVCRYGCRVYCGPFCKAVDQVGFKTKF